MVNMIYKYLHLANYKDIPNWSVQYVDEEDLGFTKKYPMARIGTFLTRRKEAIVIQDGIIYKRVTVSTKGGNITIRDEKDGKLIGTKKQFVIHEGQFLLSKIDARNGAYGVVPAIAEGAIITGNFWTYDVDYKRINPQFLTLVTKTQQFLDFAEKSSNGTTNRHYLQEDAFLNQQIPLPSITEQEDIVRQYYRASDTIKKIEEKIVIENTDVLKYWIETLGIDILSKERIKDGKLSFTRFSSISQWGIDFINEKKSQEEFSKYFKSLKICEICKIGSGGTPTRSNKRYYSGTIPWIKTGELNNDIVVDSEEKITQEALENSSAKLYPANCIVMAMYGATIGKTAKLGIAATTNQACAVLYDIDSSIVDTDYLWFYLQTQTEKFKELAYGGAQPNINAGIVADYLIPVPSLIEQRNMVEHTKGVRALVQSLKMEMLKKTEETKRMINSILFEQQ